MSMTSGHFCAAWYVIVGSVDEGGFHLPLALCNGRLRVNMFTFAECNGFLLCAALKRGLGVEICNMEWAPLRRTMKWATCIFT